MDQRIIALAIEALESRQEAIQAEINALRGTKSGNPKPTKRSETARNTQSERMKAYWAKKKRAAKASKPAKRAAVRKPGPQSAAAKKAASERMKAYWAKRKAAKGKGSEQAKA